jgi:hypothetical protein
MPGPDLRFDTGAEKAVKPMAQRNGRRWPIGDFAQVQGEQPDM